MLLRQSLIFWLLVLSSGVLSAQRFHDFVHKNITYYSPDEIGGFSQSWVVTQGYNGLMYFGNGAGILEYDGTNWRTIELNSAVRAFYRSGNGIIYAGGDELIGYLKPDDLGKMEFFSLLDSIPEGLRDFVAVLSVYRKDGMMYFIAFKGIYIFKDDRFVKAIRPATDFRYGFQIRNKIFVRQTGKGLMEVRADSVRLIKGGAFFADKPLYMMTSYGENKVLFGTSTGGLFTSTLSALLEEKNPSLDIREFVTPANGFIARNSLYHGIVLENKDIAIATTLGGVIVTDSTGRVKNIYNKHNGLKIANTSWLYQDNFGNIWVALQNGIAKIEMGDPLGFFPGETVIPGLINTCLLKNNTFYVGTMEGLYVMEVNPSFLKDEKMYRISKLNSDYNSVMQLQLISNEILASTRFGLYTVGEKIMRKISNEEFGFLVYHYKKDPRILFSTNSNGLVVYEQKNGTWKLLGQVGGITYEVRSVSETRDGDVWLNTFQGKMPRLRFKNRDYLSPQIRWYDKEDGLPDLYKMNVERDFDSLTVMSVNGYFSYNGKTDRFKRDSIMPAVYGGDTLNYFNYCFYKRNLIYSYTDKGFIKTEINHGNTTVSEIIYPRGIAGQSFVMYPDTTNQILWYSSDFGLYALNLNETGGQKDLFSTVVRQITAGKDSVIYYGVGSDTLHGAFTLPFEKNSVTIQFSCLFFEKSQQNEYRYMLSGLDTAWSAWTKESKVHYPFLPEGKYVFMVKSRNHYNHESEVTSFTLIISSPWFRSWWAYLLYLAGFIVVTMTLIRWYSRRLKKANIRLENTVRQRTSEIENQKNEIELKNIQLQIINKELEKLSIVASETDNAIMIMDASGKFEWINDGFVRLNQYRLENLIQERADNIFDYSKSTRIGEYFRQCVGEKKTVIYEAEVLRRDGSAFWAQTTLTPVLNAEGRVSKVVAIDSDITRLKEVEREVLKQKEELEKTRDQLEKTNSDLEKMSIVARETDNVVMIMDKDGNYEWINESLKKMYGITPDELYAWKDRSLLSTSYTGEIHAVWKKCISEKKSVTYQALAQKYKGEKFWTQTTLTPILDADGEVVKVIGIDTDINKIKQAEEKILSQSKELARSLRELQLKSKMISQSIEYAEKIQKAILHNENHLQEIFPDSFVLLMPRDVVSGDFCWFFSKGSQSVIVAADCTGHGVPGAFMSLIGSSLLNEIIREKNIMDPSRILSEMNEKTIAVLRQKQQGESIQEDGLDVAVCTYNSVTRQLTFAGANMPLVLYNSDGLVKVHGDLYSIGGTFSTRKNVRFKNQVFDAAQFDGFFMFSDGFQDQFGGGENRKFMADSFFQLLGKIAEFNSGGQKEQLLKVFDEWKGEARQIDDVLVIGCKFRSTDI